MANSTKLNIEFTSPEYIEFEKDTFWYLGIGILLFGAGAVAFYYADYLTVAVLIALAVAIFRFANVRPKDQKVALSEQGITVGAHMLHFHQIKSFWLSGEAQPILHLERSGYKSVLLVPVPTKEVVAIESLLSQYLPHHSHKGEHSTERIRRLFRF